jgi:alcohol dehydrogenase, propanol-preferring
MLGANDTQTTMKAAVVRSFGKPLEIHLPLIEDVPMPVPGPGEVLVKLKAGGFEV